ncbi:type II toxin-antitoxin system VapC family toxin [Phormidesmis sp. 146-35]
MRYLLDTCVISDFIKGETGTKARLKQTPPVDIAVSAITVMELRYGLALNPQRAQEIEATIASFLASVTILPFSIVEAEQAAQIRAALKSQGQPIGAYDVLIAATALQQTLLMVTANQREFDRVPGLQTENWRQPQKIG